MVLCRRIRSQKFPHRERDARVVLPGAALSVEEEVKRRRGIHRGEVSIHRPKRLVQGCHTLRPVAFANEPRGLNEAGQMGKVGYAPREDRRLETESIFLVFLSPKQESSLEAQNECVLEAESIGETQIFGDVDGGCSAADMRKDVGSGMEVDKIVLCEPLTLQVVLKIDILAISSELRQLPGRVPLEFGAEDLCDHFLSVVFDKTPLLEASFVHSLTVLGQRGVHVCIGVHGNLRSGEVILLLHGADDFP